MDPADLFADVLRARVLQKVHTRLACGDPGAQPDDSRPLLQPSMSVQLQPSQQTPPHVSAFSKLSATKAPKSPPSSSQQVRNASKDSGKANGREKRRQPSERAKDRNRGRVAWETVRAAENSSRLIASLQGALEAESKARERAEQDAGDAGLLGFDFARALKKMRTVRASFPRMLLCADQIVQLV